MRLDQLVNNLTAQIQTLEIGESVARVERYEMNALPPEGIGAVLEKIRRSVAVLTSRQRFADGPHYRTTSGILVADGNTALIAVVVVTRFNPPSPNGDSAC